MSVISLGDNAFESCTGLRRAYLYLTSSEFKVVDPSDGWFAQTNQNLELHIPAIIARTPEMVASVYGPYWNCHSSGIGFYNLISYIADL